MPSVYVGVTYKVRSTEKVRSCATAAAADASVAARSKAFPTSTASIPIYFVLKLIIPPSLLPRDKSMVSREKVKHHLPRYAPCIFISRTVSALPHRVTARPTKLKSSSFFRLYSGPMIALPTAEIRYLPGKQTNKHVLRESNSRSLHLIAASWTRNQQGASDFIMCWIPAAVCTASRTTSLHCTLYCTHAL